MINLPIGRPISLQRLVANLFRTCWRRLEISRQFADCRVANKLATNWQLIRYGEECLMDFGHRMTELYYNLIPVISVYKVN